MKDLQEIDLKELKAVVKELNESGLLPKKIKLVAISKEELVKALTDAVESLPEEAKVPQLVADFYNDLYADEMDEDDDSEDLGEEPEEEDETDEDESVDETDEDEYDDQYEDDEEDDTEEETGDEEAEEVPEPVVEPAPKKKAEKKKEEKKKPEPKEKKAEKKKEEKKPEVKEEPKKDVDKKKPVIKEKKKDADGNVIPKAKKTKKSKKEEIPQNEKVTKEMDELVKGVFSSLTKKSSYFDLDVAVIKGFLKDPKISPKELQKNIAEKLEIDIEKIKRESTKVLSCFHYLIGNYPESKEKSKLNKAVKMLLNGEVPKFVHSSTVIVIKRMILAYGVAIGLKFKESK